MNLTNCRSFGGVEGGLPDVEETDVVESEERTVDVLHCGDEKGVEVEAMINMQVEILSRRDRGRIYCRTTRRMLRVEV